MPLSKICLYSSVNITQKQVNYQNTGLTLVLRATLPWCRRGDPKASDLGKKEDDPEREGTAAGEGEGADTDGNPEAGGPEGECPTKLLLNK